MEQQTVLIKPQLTLQHYLVLHGRAVYSCILYLILLSPDRQNSRHQEFGLAKSSTMTYFRCWYLFLKKEHCYFFLYILHPNSAEAELRGHAQGKPSDNTQILQKFKKMLMRLCLGVLLYLQLNWVRDWSSWAPSQLLTVAFSFFSLPEVSLFWDLPLPLQLHA